MNWILSVLFITIIIRDYRISRQLLIKARKKTSDKVLILIAGIVFFYLFYKYAKIPSHYLVGILGVTVLIVGYFKNGITAMGIASMYRGAQFIPWNKIKEVNVYKGKIIKVSYGGDRFYNSLYFQDEEYNRVIELLNEKLPNLVIKIDYEPV